MANIGLHQSVEELRPILEMHRIKVIPLSAPYESVTLENLHDFIRNAVAVADLTGPRFSLPEPVIRRIYVQIYGNSIAVRARQSGISHRAADKRPGRWI